MKKANLINGPCESMMLDNGVEITYFELGQEHEEVMVFPAFYFYTLYEVAKALAERFHVYGVIMRFDGPGTQLDPDGSISWNKQYGEDVYKFCAAKGLDRFHYFGKCHGVNPGWYLMKHHPGMIETFCSFTLAPHIYPQESNVWMTNLYADQRQGLMSAMKKPEKIDFKMQEVNALGPAFNSPIIPKYAAYPEKIWDEDYESVKRFLTEDVSIPVCFLFGTDDPLFHDYEKSNLFAMLNTKGARSVILQGERHLLEVDAPKRLAWEAFSFIEWTRLADE